MSELALGTQRWGGADFNSPDEALCFELLDRGVAAGINLVDTAEQYPIPRSARLFQYLITVPDYSTCLPFLSGVILIHAVFYPQ